jgi:hypothetical protein
MNAPSRRAGSFPVLALCALFALAALCACRYTTDWDLFWHLSIGREAVQKRSLLPVDIFSYSALGAPWRYKDLVAAVLLYGAFALFGTAALAVLKGGAVIAIGAALWLAPLRDRRASLIWLPVLTLLLLGICYRIGERPLLFSLALFPFFLCALERVRRDAAEPPRLVRSLGAVVLLLWVWALLHREVMVGLLLFTGLPAYFLLARILGQVRPRWPLFRISVHRRSPRLALVAAFGAWLLCALNPSGLSLYTTSFGVLHSNMLRQYILEWHTMSLHDLWTVLTWAMGLSTAALLLVAGRLLHLAVRGLAVRGPAGPGVADGTGPDALHLLLLALLFGLTLSSPRWVPFLASTAAVSLVLLLGEIRTMPWAFLDRLSQARGKDLLCALVCTSLLGALHPYPIGVGLAPRHYPQGAVAYATSHHLHRRAANTLSYGGYLMWSGWPGFLVEVDGRNDTVYSAHYVIACYQAEHDAATFVRARRADGVDWVLAGTGEAASHAFLLYDPAWALVYFSDAGNIYVRRDAYPELRSQWLRFVPLLFAGRTPSFVLQQAREAGAVPALLAELQRVTMEARPDESLDVQVWLMQVYHELGPEFAAQRDAVVRDLLRTRPDVADRLQDGRR